VRRLIARTELARPVAMTSPPNEPFRDWNREGIWNAADAAQEARLRHRRLLITAGAVVLIGGFVAWAASAVVEQANATYRRVHRMTTTWTQRFAPECVRDDDCTLRPALVTCCGTCLPVRPFEALSVTRMRTLLQEADRACATRTRHCDPPVCPAPELDVDVHAVCAGGVCRAVELPSLTRFAVGAQRASEVPCWRN